MISRLREAARQVLPEGAFLRRDRGEGLFVTDAPARDPGGGWRDKLVEAGFLVEVTGGLARLTPGAKWLAALEARFPRPPSPFCATLFRFAGLPPEEESAGLPPEEESLALFALGVKAREDPEAAARFDRRLRQRAAECLRLNGTNAGNGVSARPSNPSSGTAFMPSATPSTHGGGLYACALLKEVVK